MQHPKASRPLVEDLSFDDGGRKQDFPWGRNHLFCTFFVLLYNIQSGGCSLSVSCFKSEAVTSMYCTVVSRLKDEQPVMPAKTFAGGPNSDMC